MQTDARQRVEFARRMARHDSTLRLYAILDWQSCNRRGLDVTAVAHAWREADVRLVQYRDKLGTPAQIVERASRLREMLPDSLLILNDSAALVEPCGFDGVHLGQGDLSVEEAREVLTQDHLIGISTHSADQALAANSRDVDYIAIGPVFATQTKADAEPAVGLCGVQAARAVTSKPLVAIGGVHLENARDVRRAGADSVAVISALLPGGGIAQVKQAAQDFLARFQ